MSRLFASLFGICFMLVVALIGGGVFAWYHFGRDLPDYTQLADYEPPEATRLYAGDGRLLAEYATERRVFVPISSIPQQVIDAFISAEDKNFYNHPGIDVFSIARAAVTNFQNRGTDKRLVGASTITQQVAKNFLVGNELSYERKIKEAIISFRIEQALSKNRILELYLNQIYLGRGAYGVAAAALNYFDKSLDELTVAEVALLAAMPKAPTNYDPDRHPESALARRDWVIGRMREDGRLSDTEVSDTLATPVDVKRRVIGQYVSAGFFAEEVRREIAHRFGDKALYEGGLAVRSTLDPHLQEIADRELKRGLEAYDRRHGWRGPLARVKLPPRPGSAVWKDALARVPVPAGLGSWQMAVVLDVDRQSAEIGLADGTTGRIPFAEMRWAKRWLKGQRSGAAPASPANVVSVGDVVAVEPLAAVGSGGRPSFALRQIPDIDGAIVALDPHTGRVLAMSGGYSAKRSEFNRATQALRQPGSSFKPFVYVTALQEGYTPSTLILDAPISLYQGPGLPMWTPENYSGRFYGPTTMRVGLEKSRNVMTVRLAMKVGMDKVVDTVKRFGIVDNMPPHLAYALGAGETTLLRMTAGYAMFVNGGKHITPTLIDRVQDRHGRTVFRHDTRPCADCRRRGGDDVPSLPDIRGVASDPASAYQIVSMLQGVVERGTGERVKAVGKPIAGKTGTTNDAKDAWFIGFTPDLVVGVFVGFDDPRTLGADETGGAVASPIFRDFMLAALADAPATPFRVPPDVYLVRVDAASGQPTAPGGRNVIFEAYRAGTEPSAVSYVIGGDDGDHDNVPSEGPTAGTGGLY